TLAKRKQILKVYETKAKAFVSKKRKALSQIQDKHTYKISRTTTTLINEEVGTNCFDQYATENNARNNMNNIKNNKNTYNILPQ
ncbi:39707_t:CDS:1, partial [Gigaspora margarita]